MFRSALSMSLLVLGLCVVVVGRATCEPFPVAWSYRSPFNETVFPNGLSGGLSFPNTGFQSFTADQTILASAVSSYSIAAVNSPDVLRDEEYSLALDIRDDASGEIARLQLKGVLSGSIWQKGATLENEFRSSDAQTVSLGGNDYAVSLTGFAAPTGYGVAASGGIYATVHISSANPDEHQPNSDAVPFTTPEPATLVLCGIGFTAIACLRNRCG